MNPWIVLTVCATVVFVALIWAAVILAAADRAAKAMAQPKQSACNCRITGPGIGVKGSGTAADPYTVNPFDMRTEKKEG